LIQRDSTGDITVRIPFRKERPYDPIRKHLYSVDELMEGWGTPANSLDERIAKYYTDEGSQVPQHAEEALCQRIHDDYIDRLVLDFVNGKDESDSEPRKLVGIMGGHVEDRKSKFYEVVAETAYQLTKMGYCVLTGGGPGVMEAGNLGAYMSGYTQADLKKAIASLAVAPSYPSADSGNSSNAAERKNYVEAAMKVRSDYPRGKKSLGVPTWAYSDEPTGQFASHIAKYFANSIREDGLLAIAAYGVIFGPGAAGTSQEIFQDAAHNSYWSFGSRGPMVFLGTEAYRRSPSLYDVVLAAANRDGYCDFLALVDDATSAVTFIQKHPPVKKPGALRSLGRSRYVYALA
jgi:hypothetical protein